MVTGAGTATGTGAGGVTSVELQRQHIHAPEVFIAPHWGHDVGISAMSDLGSEVFIDERSSPLERRSGERRSPRLTDTSKRRPK